MTDIGTVDELDEMRARACAVFDDGHDEYWKGYLDNARAIREADERAGLLTVPVEPTAKMLFGTKGEFPVSMGMVWKQMIEVSPFFPKVVK